MKFKLLNRTDVEKGCVIRNVKWILTLHPNIKEMVLLLHATLQWQSIGEKQSKFLMFEDNFSEPGHLSWSFSRSPGKCLCKCLFTGLDI